MRISQSPLTALVLIINTISRATFAVLTKVQDGDLTTQTNTQSRTPAITPPSRDGSNDVWNEALRRYRRVESLLQDRLRTRRPDKRVDTGLYEFRPKARLFFGGEHEFKELERFSLAGRQGTGREQRFLVLAKSRWSCRYELSFKISDGIIVVHQAYREFFNCDKTFHFSDVMLQGWTEASRTDGLRRLPSPRLVIYRLIVNPETSAIVDRIFQGKPGKVESHQKTFHPGSLEFAALMGTKIGIAQLWLCIDHASAVGWLEPAGVTVSFAEGLSMAFSLKTSKKKLAGSQSH